MSNTCSPQKWRISLQIHMILDIMINKQRIKQGHKRVSSLTQSYADRDRVIITSIP